MPRSFRLTNVHQRAGIAMSGLAVPDRLAHRYRFVDKAQRVKTIGDTLLGANHVEIHRPRAMAAARQGSGQRSGVKPQLGGEQSDGFLPMLVDKLSGLRQFGPCSEERRVGTECRYRCATCP